MTNGPAGPSQPHFSAASREIKRPSATHLILAESRREPPSPSEGVRAAAEEPHVARQTSGAASGPAASERVMPRILLVDDDTDVLESTRELLQEEGYEVLVAEDGAQALAFAERDAPDLVILDIVMPHHSGLSVLQRLRRGYRRPPKVIVLTGNAEPRVRQCAQSAGVDAFVQKPFDIDHLLATVQDLLSQL